jgi:uncharacterized protein (TIGR03067 family)
MRTACQVILLSILTDAVLMGAPRPKEDRKPEPPPEGDWVIEKEEKSGVTIYSKPKRPSDRDQRFVRHSPNKWAVFRTDDEKPIREWPAAYFKRDTDHEVDFFPDQPKFLRKGIWKLDDDILLVCYDDVGGERPTEFTAPKGSNRVLYTLRRKGKE